LPSAIRGKNLNLDACAGDSLFLDVDSESTILISHRSTKSVFHQLGYLQERDDAEILFSSIDSLRPKNDAEVLFSSIQSLEHLETNKKANQSLGVQRTNSIPLSSQKQGSTNSKHFSFPAQAIISEDAKITFMDKVKICAQLNYLVGGE
jgi:hypothetical protein